MGLTEIQISPDREKITLLERKMAKLPQVELQLQHYFKNGMYARVVHVPKDTMICGKIHSTGTVGVLAKGSMAVHGEDGETKIVASPYIHTAEPGFKRVGLALEDVVWVTIHRTDSTDLDQIEKDEFIVEYGGVDMFDFATGKLKPQHELDRQDFHRVLTDLGISAETVLEESEYDGDRFDLDLFCFGVELRSSDIEGLGIFATKSFSPGTVIGPANIGGKRTQLGRYINHAVSPNAEMSVVGGDIVLVALVPIAKNQEITTDYRRNREVRKCLV